MKRRIRRLAAAVRAIMVGGILAACATIPPPVPPDDGEFTCTTMCNRARAMGCKHGNNLPDGTTCEAVCIDVSAGGDFSLDLECRTMAATCEAAEACEAER